MIKIKGHSKRLVILTAILVFTLLLAACDVINEDNTSFEPRKDDLLVHFIDIGQGDSTLVDLPNGEYALIDGGPRSSSDKLLNYLKEQGIKKIDYVIATHPHEDHIGGLPGVLKEFEIGNIYMPERTANTKIFESLLKEIQNKGLKIKIAKAGDQIIDEDGLSFKFLAPVRTDYDNTNDYSIVSRIDYGNNSLLVMGDAEAKSERDIIDSRARLKADVLRVGHHGSSTSSTREFLDAVDAKDYIMSLGIDNSYGHPHRETIDNISLKDGNIYRTDEMGDIIMVSDGNKISFNKGPKKVTEDNSLYIGNKNTEIYHSEDCSYLPGKANRIEFKSRKEALKSGFRPHSCVK